MKNVLILGANGQIARIVAKRVLSEQDDVQLTLYLRKSHRVDDLVATNPARVRTVDADIHDQEMLDKAVQGQDIVFISNVDHDPDNKLTQGVIAAMIKNDVKRVIASKCFRNLRRSSWRIWSLEYRNAYASRAQSSSTF